MLNALNFERLLTVNCYKGYIRFAYIEVVWLDGPCLGHETMDLKNFMKTILEYFFGLCVLKQPLLNSYQSSFSLKDGQHSSRNTRSSATVVSQFPLSRDNKSNPPVLL
jgi:hypothetical protein